MLTENPYKVRLIPASAPAGTPALTFDASPNISEARTVNYNSLDPLHAPGQIQVYKNTSSRNFQISDVKLISRTVVEADANLRKLWLLRSWCMPRFGNSSNLSINQRWARDIKKLNVAGKKKGLNVITSEHDTTYHHLGTELLGAPPPILYFSAYSSSSANTNPQTNKAGKTVMKWDIAQHINRVPTVIQQLTIPYPNDVDYITTTSNVPMPIIMNIDISLIETHSPNAYEAFNLAAFKEGRLQGF